MQLGKDHLCKNVRVLQVGWLPIYHAQRQRAKAESWAEAKGKDQNVDDPAVIAYRSA